MRIELKIPLYLSEICAAIGSKPTATERKITHITTDSREVAENDLFIALRGVRFDGEAFINEAIKKGAVILSTQVGIITDNTEAALLALASYYKKKLKNLIYTVAVTGSVGKTTTKEFCRVLAEQRYKTHYTPGNFNNNIGMPLTVLDARDDTEVLIIELGMNHQGEISRLSRCVSPDIGVITNIGTAHIGNLGSRKNIAEAKMEISDGMKDGILIVPKNEPLLRGSKSFSSVYKDADIYIKSVNNNIVEVYENGIALLRSGFAISGIHMIECLAAAVTVGRCINLDLADIKTGISSISIDNTRQNVLHLHDYYIFADFYNASYESMIADFKLLSFIEGYESRSALIGDILELGEHSESIHYDLGREITLYGFDKLFLFGKYSASVRDGAVSSGFDPQRIYINKDPASPEITAMQIHKNHSPREIILFKASHGMHLERVVKILSKLK